MNTMSLSQTKPCDTKHKHSTISAIKRLTSFTLSNYKYHIGRNTLYLWYITFWTMLYCWFNMDISGYACVIVPKLFLEIAQILSQNSLVREPKWKTPLRFRFRGTLEGAAPNYTTWKEILSILRIWNPNVRNRVAS